MDVGNFFAEAAGFLTTAAGGGGLGAITGTIGAGIGAVFKFFQRRQENRFEEKKWDHEIRLRELALKAKAQEQEHELAVVEQQGSWDGLTSSIEAAASISDNVSPWVNNIRGATRPFLTLALWILAAVVFFAIVRGMLNDALDTAVIADLTRYMVFSVFYSASTATVWWFGDRAMTPPGMKNRITLPATGSTWSQNGTK